MTQWSPNAETLQQLLSVLQPATVQQTSRVNSVLDNLNALSQQNPDLPRYYAHILVHCTDVNPGTRQLAGSQLSKQFIQNLTWDQSDKQATFYSILPGLSDQNVLIRNSTSQAVTKFITSVGFENSFPFLDQLLSECASENELMSDGACESLKRIVEDNTECFHLIRLKENLVSFVSKIIGLIQRPNPSTCKKILVTLETIFECNQSLFDPSMNNLLNNVFACLAVSDVGLQALATRILTNVAQKRDMNHPLAPRVADLITHILYCMGHENEQLVMSGLNFWDLVLDNKELIFTATEQQLANIASVLVRRLVYGDEDLIPFREELENANVSSEPQLRPSQGWYEPDDDANMTLEDQIDGQDTPRKAAFRSLVKLSENYPEHLTTCLLPAINDLFQKTNPEQWEELESGILTLKILARHCTAFLHPHLPAILSLVLSFCQHSVFLVRTMSLSTLSSYSIWICGPLDERDLRVGYADQSELALPRANNSDIFEKTLSALHAALHDHSTRVQKEGCSSLTTIVAEARSRIIPYADQLLDVLLDLVPRYTSYSLRYLFETIPTLVEATHGLFNETTKLQKLMESVLGMMEKCENTDDTLLPWVLLAVQKLLDEINHDAISPYLTRIMAKSFAIIDDENTSIQQQVELNAQDQSVVTDALRSEREMDIRTSGCNTTEYAIQTLHSCIRTTPVSARPTLITSTNYLAFLFKELQGPSLSALGGIFDLVGQLAEGTPDALKVAVSEGTTLLSSCFPLLLQYAVPSHINTAYLQHKQGSFNVSSPHAGLEHRLSHSAIVALGHIIDVMGGEMNEQFEAVLGRVTQMLILAAPITPNATIVYNPKDQKDVEDGIQTAIVAGGVVSRVAWWNPTVVCQALEGLGVISHFLQCLSSLAINFLITLSEMAGLVKIVWCESFLPTLCATPVGLLETLGLFLAIPDASAENEGSYLSPDLRAEITNAVQMLKQRFGDGWTGIYSSLSSTAQQTLPPN
ncbi:putative Importin subunit beta-2 [Blattamonas nauphoetae]|uniref:Importin subunit beta-2 n=1 Tax=Blattamonas nauphoetae TaxID=2049346 RepID=A0ABQ9XC53_9EUKA|nr:putative Importin subunit beta-2 [Blattamonas nauphoetae]